MSLNLYLWTLNSTFNFGQDNDVFCLRQDIDDVRHGAMAVKVNIERVVCRGVTRRYTALVPHYDLSFKRQIESD